MEVLTVPHVWPYFGGIFPEMEWPQEISQGPTCPFLWLSARDGGTIDGLGLKW
jgi:hypothetical protein